MLESSAASVDRYALPEIDAALLAKAGIRQVQGKHLMLLTDLPEDLAIDELPRVFDLAAAAVGQIPGSP